MERFIKNFIKGIGVQFSRFDLGVVMALIISFVGTIYTNGFIVNDWPRLLISGLIFSLLLVACFQLVGLFFTWLGNSINLLYVKPVEDGQSCCNIEIMNGYDEDISDLRIELKRLTIIGYRIDCKIGNVKPFFLSGKRNDGNKIHRGDTATINIAEILESESDKFILNFLIDPVWKGNHIYRNLSIDSETKKYGELAGVLYEFIIEVSGKAGDDYINQVYRGRIRYLTIYYENVWQPGIHWMGLDKYSMKKEAKRDQWRPDNEVIKSKDDFWRLLRNTKGKK